MWKNRPPRYIQGHIDSSKARDDLNSQAAEQMTCLWMSSKIADHRQKDIYLSPSAEKKAHSIQSCGADCLQSKCTDPPSASLMAESMVCRSCSEVICKKLLKKSYKKARLLPRVLGLAINHITALYRQVGRKRLPSFGTDFGLFGGCILICGVYLNCVQTGKIIQVPHGLPLISHLSII